MHHLPERPAPHDIGGCAASKVFDAFEVYQSTFFAISSRAQHRFENNDYRGAQEDAELRLGLYEEFVRFAMAELSEFPRLRAEKDLWIEAKARFSEIVDSRYDRELAQTFFNSVTRRMHGTVGVDSGIEFYDSDFAIQPLFSPKPLVFEIATSAAELSRALAFILSKSVSAGTFRALRGESLLAAKVLSSEVRREYGGAAITGVAVLKPLFFRDGMAYVIGRVVVEGQRFMPFALPLKNTPAGVAIDAVLHTEDQVSILFSFARSYFFVPTKFHLQLIEFLKELLPRKRPDEIYASIGHHKHAKTELHRLLRWHLARSTDSFGFTRGKVGMVMIAFTLPSYEVVFKIIRDRVKPPKQCTRQRVLDCYSLVFKHDRVGRMVDTQEFVNLKFKRSRFEPELLEELLSEAPQTVSVSGDTLTIRHLYTERRVVPLDVYIKEVSLEKAQAAIIDYGFAIKELAAANIFPGDLFLKNFGVTRHGRVVFYDYDEVCLLTDCNFRSFPQATSEYQELESEPWFAVRENDIFPEEFRSFLGIPNSLLGAFEKVHGDLFSPYVWRDLQESHRAREFIEVLPYREECQLEHIGEKGMG